MHGQSYVLTNGEPRPVAELLAGICAAAGVDSPGWRVPASVARAAGSLIEAVWRVKPGADEPPMTRFLAEQLSTTHWYDMAPAKRDFGYVPTVSLHDGLTRLKNSWNGT